LDDLQQLRSNDIAERTPFDGVCKLNRRIRTTKTNPSDADGSS